MFFSTKACSPFEICILSMFLVNHLVTSVFVYSTITGPIGKECADLWPVIASATNAHTLEEIWSSGDFFVFEFY